MSQTTPPILRRFKFFGWNIYISRHKLRRKETYRSKNRRSVKHRRLEYAGNRCELCGVPIDDRCVLFHLLPAGSFDRNNISVCRVICQNCLEHVQTVGAYRPMIGQKGGES